MSDSGRSIGDCHHAKDRDGCVECLRIDIARLRDDLWIARACKPDEFTHILASERAANERCANALKEVDRKSNVATDYWNKLGEWQELTGFTHPSACADEVKRLSAEVSLLHSTVAGLRGSIRESETDGDPKGMAARMLAISNARSNGWYARMNGAARDQNPGPQNKEDPEYFWWDRAWSECDAILGFDEVKSENARLGLSLEGRDKAIALLNAGVESQAELCDRLKQENRKLRACWELADTDKVIDGQPYQILMETKTGDRRRIGVACPEEFDKLARQLERAKSVMAVHGVMADLGE